MKPAPLYASRARDGVVLVVDDIERNVQLVGELLTNHRFEVLFATSGPAALDRLTARIPDLILLDLMMPGMDGIAVCQKLRANPATADIPVIFLTAAHDAELAVKALNHGAVDYITKPFHAQELLARVRTHVELKRMRDNLRKVVAEKSELMEAVAHDLKNPISAVRFAALTLLGEAASRSTETGRELLDTIVDASGDMLGMIERRLEKNARAAQLERLELAPVDLAEILGTVVQQNRATAHAKGISLTFEPGPGSRTFVLGDYYALCEVFDNLVSNAIKFSPAGRPVTVALMPGSTAGALRGEVRDRGPGITAEDRQNLFQAYRRLSAKPTAGETSTGLGLSIARALVEKMNGFVDCESVPGKGTTFWVELPQANLGGT